MDFGLVALGRRPLALSCDSRDSRDRQVPLKTVIFMACVSGAVATEALNLPARFTFAMVFAALMTVCPDVWVDVPRSPLDELEEARREIADLKRAKIELLEQKVRDMSTVEEH